MELSATRPTFHRAFSVGVRHKRLRHGKVKVDFHKSRGSGVLPLDWNQPCCHKNCVRQFDNPETQEALLNWRLAWFRLGQAARRDAVLEYARDQISNGSAVNRCESFLGRALCVRAFRRLTGVSGCLITAARRWARRDALRPPEHKRLRTKPVVMDAMHGAIVEIMNHMRNRMPLKDEDADAIFMPLSHPIQL